MTDIATARPVSGRKTRVLFCEAGHSGGSVAQLHHLIRCLDPSQLDMGFVSFHKDAMAAKLFELPGLFCRQRVPLTPSPAPDTMKPLGAFWVPTPFALLYCLVAMHVVARYRPHVIYLNNSPRDHLPMLWVAARTGLPVICHLREAIPLRGVDRLGRKYISSYIALSQSLARHYIAEGVDPSLINVAYDSFILSEFDRRALRPPTSVLPPGPLYAVQVATLNENKRPLLAVQAFAIAKDTCPGLKLVLIGEGSERKRVEDMIRKYNLQRDVILMGQRSDVPSLLSQCQIGILLSKREGFPNVVLEYMASRLPVVVSQTASIYEMVIPSTTAFVLDDPTPVEVATTLARLYNDSALRFGMGRAARQHLERSPSVTHGATPTVQSLIQSIGRS